MAVNFLDQTLARLVGGVGFASKNDLNRLFLVCNNVHQAFVISEYQVRTFVGCKTTGKTDGKRQGIKQDAAGDGLNRMNAIVLPLAASTGNHVTDQLAFQMNADLPKFIVRNCVDPFPHFRVVQTFFPINIEIFIVEISEPTRKPGAGVNSIGDVADGHILGSCLRPKVIPHLARYFTMKLGNAIAVVGKPQCQYWHTENLIRPVGVDFCQIHKLIAVQPQLAPIVGEILVYQPGRKFVVASWNGCMSRKNAGILNNLLGFFQAMSLVVHQLVHSLQRQKGGMTFVHMVDCWTITESLQGAQPADTQQHLLRNAKFRIADVEFVGQLAILGIVFGNVGMQKNQGYASNLNLVESCPNSTTGQVD